MDVIEEVGSLFRVEIVVEYGVHGVDDGGGEVLVPVTGLELVRVFEYEC